MGVYTLRYCSGVVVKRRMEREVEQEAGHDLQVGLDPGEGLEEGGGQEVKPIWRMLGPIWRVSQAVACLELGT